MKVFRCLSPSSVLVGLTLAVDPDFKVLFVVLVFHRKQRSYSLLYTQVLILVSIRNI